MIVLCVMNCPPGLRGDLSKWLNEVNTGVYVGRLNARVREELWNRVCSNIKSGQATMVYSTNNEQGFAFLTHNTTWIPVDYEGITLMKKPLSVKEDKDLLRVKAVFHQFPDAFRKHGISEEDMLEWFSKERIKKLQLVSKSEMEKRIGREALESMKPDPYVTGEFYDVRELADSEEKM